MGVLGAQFGSRAARQSSGSVASHDRHPGTAAAPLYQRTIPRSRVLPAGPRRFSVHQDAGSGDRRHLIFEPAGRLVATGSPLAARAQAVEGGSVGGDGGPVPAARRCRLHECLYGDCDLAGYACRLRGAGAALDCDAGDPCASWSCRAIRVSRHSRCAAPRDRRDCRGRQTGADSGPVGLHVSAAGIHGGASAGAAARAAPGCGGPAVWAPVCCGLLAERAP
jgi:hypothetical protein